MISNLLKHRLDPVIRAEENLRRQRITALGLGLASVIGLALWAANHYAGFGNRGLAILWALASGAALFGSRLR